MSIIQVAHFSSQLTAANRYLANFKFPADGQRQINSEKYTGILPKEIVEEITHNTYYLTWTQIYQAVREQVQKYQPNNDFYIYIPNEGIKSNLVILAATWDLWQHKLPAGFIYGLPTNIKFKAMTVVFLDDWSLTGCSQCAPIDELTYSNKQVKFNFEILTPFRTTQALQQIYRINKNFKITENTMQVHQGQVSDQWYNTNILFEHLPFKERSQTKIDELSEEIGNTDFYCIYSDIKIPDSCCCPRTFYLQTVEPQPFNIKHELEQFFPELKSSSM